eukprot:Opistho-2@29862
MASIDDMFADLDSIMGSMMESAAVSPGVGKPGDRPRSLGDALANIMKSAELAGQERRQKEMEEQAGKDRVERVRIARAAAERQLRELELDAKRLEVQNNIDAAKARVDEATSDAAGAVARVVTALRSPAVFDASAPDILALARDAVSKCGPILNLVAAHLEQTQREDLAAAMLAQAAQASSEETPRRGSFPEPRKRPSLVDDIFYPPLPPNPHLPLQLSVDLVYERLRGFVACAKEVAEDDVAATRHKAASAAYQLLVSLRDVRDLTATAVEDRMIKQAGQVK